MKHLLIGVIFTLTILAILVLVRCMFQQFHPWYFAASIVYLIGFIALWDFGNKK